MSASSTQNRAIQLNTETRRHGDPTVLTGLTGLTGLWGSTRRAPYMISALPVNPVNPVKEFEISASVRSGSPCLRGDSVGPLRALTALPSRQNGAAPARDLRGPRRAGGRAAAPGEIRWRPG